MLHLLDTKPLTSDGVSEYLILTSQKIVLDWLKKKQRNDKLGNIIKINPQKEGLKERQLTWLYREP